MKRFFLFAVCLVMGSIVLAQPVIDSFSPQAALPSSPIVISGSGFSPTADSNIVFFGPVKGTVLNATLTDLTVKVPLGATYSFVSVTKGGLTGYSTKFFTPLSNAAGYSWGSNSFETPLFITTNGDRNKQTLRVYDADADGKTDIIAVDTSSSSVSFYRNTATVGVVNSASFAPSTFRNIGKSTYAANTPLAVYDFDGDGKKDLVFWDDLIKLFKNTGTTGQISFDDSSAIEPGRPTTKGIACADIDGDGKPDVALTTYHFASPYGIDTAQVKIFRNSTLPNAAISFSPLPEFFVRPGYNYCTNISLIDLNGDKKEDLFFANSNINTGTYSNEFFTAINSSSPGNISFAQVDSFTSFPGTIYIEQIRFADVDNDGLTDIITTNGHGRQISIFRNISTLSTIAFAPPFHIPVAGPVYDVLPADFNGDGKVDIGCSISNGEPIQRFVILFQNNSTPGNISFVQKNQFSLTDFPSSLAAGDIDGDGKQDLFVGCSYSMAVIRNKMEDAIKLFLCPGSLSDTLTSEISGNNYQWQVSTDSLQYSNLGNGANYDGTNTNALIITNIASSSYGYRYRCLVDGSFSKPIEISFKNTWIGSVDSTWENPTNWSCNALPDGNTDVVITSGNVLVGSNASCRSISVSPGASFAVLPGFSLTVTH